MNDWLDVEAWPFEARRVAVSDGALHLVDEGRGGVPLVLVHGTPTWSFEWRHVIAGLRGERRVLAFDHLGFGLSERPLNADYSPEAHARRFREAMAALVPDGPVDLVVHDYGGPIALDWAVDHASRLRHVVVVNTFMWPLDDDPKLARGARVIGGPLGRFFYRWLDFSLGVIMPGAYGDRRKLTPAIRRQYQGPFPDGAEKARVLYPLAQALLGSSHFYASLWARRASLGSVPLTFLWGMKDSAFGPHILQRFQATYPHARTVRFDGAGHWPHEEAPAEFLVALRDALAARQHGGPSLERRA